MEKQCPNCGSYKTTRRRKRVKTPRIIYVYVWVVIGIEGLLDSMLDLGKVANSNTVIFVIFAILLCLLTLAILFGLLVLLSKIMNKNLFEVSNQVFLYHCDTCGYGPPNWRPEECPSLLGDYLGRKLHIQ